MGVAAPACARQSPTPPLQLLPASRRSALSRLWERIWSSLGEFGRAHGLKGEVRLKSHTGDPLAIAAYGPLSTQAAEPSSSRTASGARRRARSAGRACRRRDDARSRRGTEPRRNSIVARDKLPRARRRGRIPARRPDRSRGSESRAARDHRHYRRRAEFRRRRPSGNRAGPQAARRRFCPSPRPSCRGDDCRRAHHGRAAGRPVRSSRSPPPEAEDEA